MHNMIVENGGKGVPGVGLDHMGAPINLTQHDTIEFEKFLKMHRRIGCQEVHTQLLNHLVEHVWVHHGNK